MQCNLNLALVLLSGLLAACGTPTTTVDSQTIATSDIVILSEVIVTEDAAGTLVTTLKVGGGASDKHIVLSSSDHLSAVTSGKIVEMEAQGPGVYETHFDNVSDSAEIVVILNRDAVFPAPSHQVAVPPPFSFVMETGSVSRAADLVFTWDPKYGPLDLVSRIVIDFSGPCISSVSMEAPIDTNSITIPAGTLKGSDSAMTTSCEVEVQITRSLDNVSDPDFHGDSRFVASQVRTGKFTSTN